MTSEKLKYVSLIILCAINLLNYMDRFTVAGIVTILQQPTDCINCACNSSHYHYRNTTHKNISVGYECVAQSSSRKNSSSGICWCCCGLGIDDEQVGLLTTIFIVSYALLSPVFGYCGDRYSRKKLIALGITIWSGFTLAGSFFKVYYAFLIMRSLVGVGEASYGTIAPTIIADLFPANKRLLMLSLFYLTTPFGSALGYIVGSHVATLFNCWQWAFRVTPVFGIILALLCLCVVQEPPRGHSDTNSDGTMQSSQNMKGVSGAGAFLNDVVMILKCKSFVWSTLGFSCMSFVVGALTQWAPTFIIWASQVAYGPKHGYTVSHASFYFGLVTVLTGVSGVLVGGEVARRWGKKNRQADALVCAIGLLGCVPFLFFALVYAHIAPAVFWALCVFAEFLLCVMWAPVAAILLYVIVPQRRSTAEAIQILFIHLLGDAFSPLIIGKISDSLRGTSHTPDVKHATPAEARQEYFALQHASYITTFVAVLGGACFLVTSFYLVQDRKAAVDATRANKRSSERVLVNSGEDEDNDNSKEPSKWDYDTECLVSGATCT